MARPIAATARHRGRAITRAGPADAIGVINAIGSAMSGMAQAIDRFDRAAARIARPEGDLIGDRVEQITAQHTFEANLATVRTSDDMLGTLIDVLA